MAKSGTTSKPALQICQWLDGTFDGLKGKDELGGRDELDGWVELDGLDGMNGQEGKGIRGTDRNEGE